MSADGSVVIIGTGVAGITAAETLRALGHTGPVTVIGDEEHLPYRRTALSKDLLGADLSQEKIRLRKPEFWTQRTIEIVTGATVDAIDADAHEVVVADGTRYPYDAVVIATGGRPRGVDTISAEVPTLRRHEDAVSLQARLDTEPVVIVGGGLIGLEIASSAAAAGAPVTVLEAAPSVLSRVMPDEVAGALIDLHSSHGVQIITGVTIAEATASSVTTTESTRYPGVVISAIGMVPASGLAQAAGATVGPAGIYVDEQLRTDVPGVYAAGDVAARPHPLTGEPARAEQWMTATDHGKLVAATIAEDLGLEAEPGAPVSRIPLAWTIHYGKNVQLAGWPGSADRIEVDGVIADFDATVRCFRDDRLIGAVCLGRPAAGRALRSEIESALSDRVGA